MKSHDLKNISFLIACGCMLLTARSAPSFSNDLNIATKNFALHFEVGKDGRLYQNTVGTIEAKTGREDESYPPAGDGYIWEPALEAIHADGNTSAALIFDNLSRTNDTNGRELTRIHLHDHNWVINNRDNSLTLQARASRK